MKRVCMLAAAMAVAWSVGVSAQGRNFSGQWTVDSEKTSAANTGEGSRVMVGGGGGRGGGGGTVTQRPTSDVTTPRISAGGGGVMAGGGGGRGGGAATPMTIAIDATSFTVSQGQTSTVYKLDGTPMVVESGARRSTSRAAWQGDRLVIQITTETESSTLSSTTTWYLEGDSLVRETAVPNPSGESVSRKTYYKRG